MNRAIILQEVDLVEDVNGKITGFEFKWKIKRFTKLPATFLNAYNADSMIVDRSNFREF